MNKTALVIGARGMVGSHMVDLLTTQGYKVYGSTSKKKGDSVSSELVYLDLVSEASIAKVIRECNPDEIYNFGAISFSPDGVENPTYTEKINSGGVKNVLKQINFINPKIKLYQAGSSEVFGGYVDKLVNEDTLRKPKTPYGFAKLNADRHVGWYRHKHNIFACTGIAFNHESERRSSKFVTKKITSGVAKIASGEAIKIELGNLNAKRDWGYAPEYVVGMWLMLQNDKPEDFIICTGIQHTVKDILDIAFNYIGISDYSKYIELNSSLVRKEEIYDLRGDNTKFKEKLGWSPKIGFEEMIKKMVQYDIDSTQR